MKLIVQFLKLLDFINFVINRVLRRSRPWKRGKLKAFFWTCVLRAKFLCEFVFHI